MVRKYFVALFAVAAFSGCTTTPDSPRQVVELPSQGGVADIDIAPAPDSLSAARAQLATMDEQSRTSTALGWASHYLKQQRPEDAQQLLSSLQPSLQDQDTQFHILLLRGRASLHQQQPQQALNLLQQFQEPILQYPAGRQAKLDLLRADALAMAGNLLDSLQQRVATHPLLDKQDQQYNHEMIWQLLMQLSATELANAIDNSNGELLGWLTLAQLYRDPIADLDAQLSRLNQWSAQWRGHPAARDVPAMQKALEKAASHRPSLVAVLLPARGPLKSAGETIKQGMLTAHYQQKENSATPTLRFYDSSGDDILAVYQQAISDGADFVLGPLAKDKVATLANQGTLPVTTLALNYIHGEQRPDNLFQYGLAPEDEARQIARHAYQQGDNQAGILFPEGEWGERVAQAFVDHWQQLGGTVTAYSHYQDGPTIGDTVEQLLLVAQSEKRAKTVSRFTNLKMEERPRRRRDMDFLFLIADPNQGRQVKPALNFHYAKDLPVYATSMIYSGTPNPRRDLDLNGVRFLETPWLLGSEDSELHQLAEQQWPQGHGRYERLFAMGIDAYRLQGRLYLLNTLPSSELPGVTGRLKMKQQKVIRELNWAIFRNGEVHALPQVNAPSSFGNRPASGSVAH